MPHYQIGNNSRIKPSTLVDDVIDYFDITEEEFIKIFNEYKFAQNKYYPNKAKILSYEFFLELSLKIRDLKREKKTPNV